MKTHRFGFTDIPVSELCLNLSHAGRYSSEAECFAILDAFHEAGGSFVQTQGSYPGGAAGGGLFGLSERFLRRWLDSRGVGRRNVVLAVRFAAPLMDRSPASVDERPLLAGLRDSLARIGTDHLDFLVIEWNDGLRAMDTTMATLADAVAMGLARHVVLAHFPTEYLSLAVAKQPQPGLIAGLELDYSLAEPWAFERGPATLCHEHELGFVPRSPLGRGHLVAWPAPRMGAVWRHTSDEPFRANAAHAIWPALTTIAHERGRTPAQIALAWVLAQHAVASAMVSVRNLAQLQELLAATRFTLSPAELQRLNGISGVVTHISPVQDEAEAPDVSTRPVGQPAERHDSLVSQP